MNSFVAHILLMPFAPGEHVVQGRVRAGCVGGQPPGGRFVQPPAAKSFLSHTRDAILLFFTLGDGIRPARRQNDSNFRSMYMDDVGLGNRSS